MKKRLTLKHRKFINNLKTSNSIREAARKAGYCITSGNFYRKPLKDTIEKYLAKSDITPNDILQHYIDLQELCFKWEGIKPDKRIEISKSISDSLARIKSMFKDNINQHSTIEFTSDERAILDETKRLLGITRQDFINTK